MNYTRSIGIGFLVLISKLLSFNTIIGSYHLTFSWTSMMAPVIVEHFGLGWIGLFFIHQKLWFSGSSIMMVLLYRTPLFFSALVFRQQTFFSSVLVPLCCMVLFVMHDIGSQAWLYTVYWLIPIVLFFISNSLVARALSASMLAHAVGSVIWLYFGDISASTWISLIPVVFCERLLIAVGILSLHVIVVKIRQSSWLHQLIQSMVRLGIA